MTARRPIRARTWLRQHDIPLRTELLLEHDDKGIVDLAREDGYRLTCPGDIQRERDAAAPPLPLTDAS